MAKEKPMHKGILSIGFSFGNLIISSGILMQRNFCTVFQ